MKEIIELSETESMNRMVYLSATPDIPPPGDWQRRTVKPLKLTAAPPASRATTTAKAEPKTLAEAIAVEIAAGNRENAGELAARKYPCLARAWVAEIEAARG